MVNLPIEVRLSGQEADFHELPAYDGFNSLAGLSLATTIITHYAATGRLRRRGQFETRSKIRFREARRGSLIFGLIVEFAATNSFILGIAGGLATNALYDLIKWTISKYIGQEQQPQTSALESLVETKLGDLDALASATEPGLRQAHSIIGNGAHVLDITGKAQQSISRFDKDTKVYISASLEEEEVIEKDVSVAAFNANSGHGRVFDEEIGRTVAFYIPDGLQHALRPVIGWGLNEYTRGSARKISIKFTRIVAIDGRPKKYILLEASRPEI